MKWNSVAVTIVKDEAPYINDWIVYHSMIGIDHFVIYDNGSGDDTQRQLSKFINAGRATVIAWPMRAGQVDAYSHALRLLRENTEWVGFLDADEFLVLHEHSSVASFLNSLNAHQVLIPWRNFPYCGHYVKPGGSVIENFMWAYRVPDDGLTQVKHFVKPEQVLNVTAHFSFLTDGKTCLADGESHRPTHAILGPTYKGAQVNHYATRSFIENEQRLAKGQVSGSAHKQIEPFQPLTEKLANLLCNETSILRQLSRFKVALQEWDNVPHYPHRFGLRQSVPCLPSFNNVIFYLSKSIGNYLTEQKSVKALTDYEFYQAKDEGIEVDVKSHLPDYNKPVLHFKVSRESFFRCFLGTVHYGDFARRFSFECLVAEFGQSLSSWKGATIETMNKGIVAMLSLSGPASEVSLVTAVDAKTLLHAKLPEGRTCALLYLPTTEFATGDTTVELRLCGSGQIVEILLGLVP